MCGISGIINFRSGFDTEHFISTSKIVHHDRGPDHFDYSIKNRVLLTHSRLKIIDLSDEANQPMTSKSGKSIIVFNGEIYNYKELAIELNFELKTDSDTEILIEYIEHFGIEKTLKKLNGMFAFCYINFENNKVYLGRDRFGQKPLYYYVSNNQLVFTSNIKVISQVYKPNLTLDFKSIDYYLSELSSPQPNTIWNEVKQLKPSHFIETDLNVSNLFIQPYWKLEATVKINNENEALEKIENTLDSAIKKRTFADVPLGCFLSGGVDSGLIVSLLASKTATPLKTFTVGFDNEEFNELEDARLIANRYQTDHTEINIGIDIENDIENILAHFGEPFADSSAIPTYYISKEIKKHVSVAISGDGGDELFGGYTDYGQAYEAEIFDQKYNTSLSKNIASLGSKLGSRLSNTITNLGSAKNYLDKNPSDYLFRNMGFSPENESIFNFPRNYVSSYFNSIWNDNHNDALCSQHMLSSIQTRLLNDYLVKVDRASMSHSLEVRSPFMDYQLAELAFSIPNSLKFKNNSLKYLLKKLGEKHMYSDIFTRKKRGFSIPIKHLLKTKLFSFAHTQISSLIARKQFINSSAILLLSDHKNEIADHTDRIWTLICLEIWLKQNID